MNQNHRAIAPERLALTEIEHACREETRRFRRQEASDTRYCLEIFRRALRPPPPDESARNLLVLLYTDVVLAHINRRTVPRSAIDDLVQQTWLRFWQAAESGLSFVALEAGIAYIGRATLSAVIAVKRQEFQERRVRHFSDVFESQDNPGETLDQLNPSSSDPLFDEVQQARFRARCREVLSDPLVLRVFWLREGMGMPPREIARRLRDEGRTINAKTPTPRLISDMLERAFQRLAADPEIRDLLQGD